MALDEARTAAGEVINGHGVINKEEGKRGDAYQRSTTNGQCGGDGGRDVDDGGE